MTTREDSHSSYGRMGYSFYSLTRNNQKYVSIVQDISQRSSDAKPYSNVPFPKQMIQHRFGFPVRCHECHGEHEMHACMRFTSTHLVIGSARISPSRGTHPYRGGASGPRPIGRGWGEGRNMPHISPCGCPRSSGWSPEEQKHTLGLILPTLVVSGIQAVKKKEICENVLSDCIMAGSFVFWDTYQKHMCT